MLSNTGTYTQDGADFSGENSKILLLYYYFYFCFIFYIFVYFFQNKLHHIEPTLKGLLYDIEYSHSTVKSLSNCTQLLNSIQKLLKDCIFFKQQIDYNYEKTVILQKNKTIMETIEKRNDQSDHSSSTSSSKSIFSSRKIFSSSTSSPKSTASKFNRFSASFDFSSASSSFNPKHIATSVSGDFKSFLNQFTSNHHSSVTVSPTETLKLSKPQQQHSKVPISNSLYTISSAGNINQYQLLPHGCDHLNLVTSPLDQHFSVSEILHEEQEKESENSNIYNENRNTVEEKI